MYKKGDYVVKIPDGICQIDQIGYLDIPGINKDKEYYILVPLKEKTAKLYIPSDRINGQIRNIISKENALTFIKSIPDIDEKNIPIEKMREQEYKTAILSGNNEKIVSIIKLIYTRNQERLAQGKKVSATDDKYFRLAEDVLFSELSFVLNVPKENMAQFIADTINS